MGFVFLISCSEKETSIPKVITGDNVVYAESMTVTCNGYVENDGGSSVYARGICYKKGNGTPTIADKTESGGSGKGSFTCNLQLNEEGTYSYCAYATNANGTAYGDVRTFDISNGSTGEGSLPGVITGECNVDDMNMTVICNGYVESDGGSSVFSRGICYVSGNGTPTIANRTVPGGSGLGNFSCTLNIENSGLYSYCAYATNSSGTSYGEVKTFLIGTLDGSVSVTFGNDSWTDNGATLFGPSNYFPNWFDLIILGSPDVGVCINPCAVGRYTGQAISGSAEYYTYEGGGFWSFLTEYESNYEGEEMSIDDEDINVMVEAESGNTEWHAKSFTITVTKYDKVSRVASMTMEAVMYNCNNAFTPEGGNVGLNAAETRVLRVVANNVPFRDDDKIMHHKTPKEKEWAERNSARKRIMESRKNNIGHAREK